MKLTIQHLAPYLPYDLQLTCNAVFMPNRKCYPKLKGAKATLNTDLLADIYSGVYDSVGRFQPILRPLSDLTKEIEHNGESFVPIEKMRKLLDSSDIVDYKGTFIDPKYQIDDEWNYCVTHETDNDILCFSYDSNSKSFMLMIEQEFQNISNQYEMFQLLFELHFDVFGLIPQGLAIDINTIQK